MREDTSGGRDRSGCFGIYPLTMLILMFLAIPMGEASANQALTLQNQKIAVFGSSWAWEPYGTHLGRIVGREVESFISGATGAAGALPTCSIFGTNKFGIIVTDFGSWDAMVGTPWDDFEGSLRELLQCLKRSGAVVVFNQLIPDSSELGEYAFAQVCREEGVYLVPNIAEEIATAIPSTFGMGFTILVDSHFKSSDEMHPIDEAYSIMAERTAKALFDAGLVERAESCEDLTDKIPELFANTTTLLARAEQEGFDTEQIRNAYAMAEYLWENQFCYTTSWKLEEEVLEPLVTVFDSYDEVTEMFSKAEALLQEARQRGMDTDETQEMETDYAYAENSWRRMDPTIARYYLQKILDLEQEILSNQEPVLGETLYQDDFNEKDFKNWMWRVGAEGTVNLRDGYALLNLTKGREKSEAGLVGYDRKWHYCGLEITLRCSDDNKLESDTGGGFRAWGFGDEIYADNWLAFSSYCPESDPDLAGFWVTSMVGGETILQERVTGIDMREWHTYTIIWDKNNGTFLVDGEVIATTNKTPGASQRLVILANSGRWSKQGPGMLIGGLGYVNWIDLKQDEQIQVDKVRVFGVDQCLMPTAIICMILPAFLHPPWCRPEDRSRATGETRHKVRKDGR